MQVRLHALLGTYAKDNQMMAKLKEQGRFMIFALMQTVFACLILTNEYAAVSRQLPMTSFPAEHQFSQGKVFLFCGVAVANLLAAWRFKLKQHLTPSLAVVLSFAVPLTTSGVFISHYLSVLGWCCESPFTFYFGFPFSFMLGIAGFDYSIQQYGHFNLLQVLSDRGLTIAWKFLPYRFFLNLLFWSNIVFLFLSLASLLVSKFQAPQLVKGQVQSESR
jgi:hypothetical protein